MWNLWRHMRLAGSVVMVVGALFNTIPLILVGLFVQYLGLIGGLDLADRRLEELEAKEASHDDGN